MSHALSPYPKREMMISEYRYVNASSTNSPITIEREVTLNLPTSFWTNVRTVFIRPYLIPHI